MSGVGSSFQNSSGFSGGDSGDQSDDHYSRAKDNDPASSGLFGVDFRKHDDLKEMLDSSDDKKKLDAMKRIIGMVAKGKDASSLFPAVVKNVACKNLEVKKLVYVYLTRYAEEQQDLALLSISTFQRSMKDPNQLIRASALRVLSSIRVPVIVPIMMLAIKDGVNDMSPYVRKAAAHALPKLYSVDPDLKDELIMLLEKLIADKTTLVLGSAIQAFEEICPERNDLIHRNYRKICSVLVDVEEWGQVIIVNMLTRYARTQFINPNQDMESTDGVGDKAFYSSNEDSSDGEEEKESKSTYIMAADHRLLLRNTKPLLNSRNASVVMAVVQLYYHCAPQAELSIVSRALIRLLRSHKEVQNIVLSNIATMALSRKSMFEHHLKSFFIRANDPIHVRLLKLEILTSLATEGNVAIMMREFQQYVLSSDKEFAAATVQSIGKIASSISDVTDACLGGLITLLSNKDEVVVGESVVVIKKLLQMKSSGHKDVIVHMAQMVDNITMPNAKSSILWLIGEYCDKVPKIAPDVLRKVAKNFVNEEDIVKLQVLNLAAKLCIANSKQTQLLCQYVFNLARYDLSYDIRDRARLLRALILPGDKAGALAKHAKKIFFVEKPVPVLQSKYKEREQYQLGTLSHTINGKAHGYHELPEWPLEAPPSSVRDVPLPSTSTSESKKKASKEKSRKFYSDEESSSEEESSEDDDDEETSEEQETEEESGEESESEEEENSEEDSEEESEAETSDEEEDESSEDEEEDSSSEEEPVKIVQPKMDNGKAAKKDSEMLLDLMDYGPGPGALSTLTPSLADVPTSSSAITAVHTTSPICVPSADYELLNRMTSGGLSVTYRFTRTPYISSPKMTGVSLTFTNSSDSTLANIKIGNKKLQSGMSIQDFPAIFQMDVGATYSCTMGIDFNDTLQPATFDLLASERSHKVKVEAPVGELLSPVTMPENEFDKRLGKLGGMNENSARVETSVNAERLKTLLCETANVGQVASSQDNHFLYAARTQATQSDVLVRLEVEGQSAKISVNCDKMVIGSMLIKDLKTAFINAVNGK